MCKKNDIFNQMLLWFAQAMILYAPETLKAKALEPLSKQKTNNIDLRYIINNAPETLKAKARKKSNVTEAVKLLNKLLK